MKDRSHKLARERAQAVLTAHAMTKPGQIDVAAIATREGISIDMCHLTGAEGYLLRLGNSGAMFVHGVDPTLPRSRFTIAHELGHWFLHDELVAIFGDGRSSGAKEGEANAFASELLMPASMCPKNLNLVPPSLWQPECIAGLFRTSLSAAALRWAELADSPLVVALSDAHGTVTAALSSTVTRFQVSNWSKVPEQSRLAVLRHHGETDEVPMDVPSSVWFPGTTGTVEEHSRWLPNAGLGVTVLMPNC